MFNSKFSFSPLTVQGRASQLVPQLPVPKVPILQATGPEELLKQLQLLVCLIAGTIPIYCAPCCYLRDQATAVFRPIIMLAHNTMLHLALSGNVLCSLGVSPILYSPDYILNSPNLIFDKILAQLPGVGQLATGAQSLTSAAIDLVSYPVNPVDFANVGKLKELLFGAIFSSLESNPNAVRSETSSTQISPEDGLWPDKGLVVVTDLQSALLALRTVLDGFDPQQIQRLLEGIDCPVVLNPNTDSYKREKFYEVSLACDAAYCLLLISLQNLWEVKDLEARKDLLHFNINPLMKSVVPLFGAFLITQQIGNLMAAPCFNFYKFGSDPCKELRDLTDKAINKYADDPLRQDMLKGIQVKVNACVPVQLKV